MLCAVICFTAMDAVAKGLIAKYPTPQVIWARFAVMGGFVLLILQRQTRQMLVTSHPWLHLLRCIFQFATVFLFFASLKYIGLAEAQALTDINPVLITLGAAVFLGERLGAARMAAVTTAMLGALIVVRPGFGVFSAAALLPLGAAVTYSASALLTRKVGMNESPWTSMLYASAFGTIFGGLALPFVWQPVAVSDLWLFILLGALGTGAQLLLIRAFSLAEASVVAPFSYVGLLTATFWGIVLYAEYPDRYTILGGLVIACAGLYVWHSETTTKPLHD